MKLPRFPFTPESLTSVRRIVFALTPGLLVYTLVVLYVSLFLEPLPSCVVSLPVATPLVPKDEMWPLFPLFRLGRSCQF